MAEWIFFHKFARLEVMKLRIGIAVLMAACVMPLVACTDDDDAIESQRSDIVRYLTDRKSVV